MKISLSLLLLLFSSYATAFQQPTFMQGPRLSATVLEASAPDEAGTTDVAVDRRRVLVQVLGVATTTIVASSLPAGAAPREVWLTEPTEEFKANEAKAMDFKRAQLAIKGQFNKVLDRFSTESNTEEALVDDLYELKGLVIKTGGLPLGIKKEELYKIIRRRKASGPWTVPTEYAYQALIREISYQQSPNTEKDEANPL